MNTNIVVASPGACFAAASRFANKLQAVGASQEAVDAFNKDGDHPLYRVIEEYFVPRATDPSSLPPEVLKALEGWRDFYRNFFEMDVDLSMTRIPARQVGFDRLILIAKGIRLNQVWNIHGEREIPTWRWWSGSLEKAMQESERGPVQGTYAFWVRDRQEADEELKNLSAEMIAEQKIGTESLLERLVHGLKYFDETRAHLDVQNVTLCASSRCADGDVPEVCRGGDGCVYVRRYRPALRSSGLRPRQTVR